MRFIRKYTCMYLLSTSPWLYYIIFVKLHLNWILLFMFTPKTLESWAFCMRLIACYVLTEMSHCLVLWYFFSLLWYYCWWQKWVHVQTGVMLHAFDVRWLVDRIQLSHSYRKEIMSLVFKSLKNQDIPGNGMVFPHWHELQITKWYICSKY